MDFSLALAVYGIPDSITDWLFASILVILTIRMERSGLALPRVAYLVSIVLRVLGLMLLGMCLMFLAGGLAAAMSKATGTSYLSQLLLPMTMIGILFSALTAFVMTRPIIWRLRDAGLDPRFAYLAIVPVVSALMIIALIFYPPSKNAESVAAVG